MSEFPKPQSIPANFTSPQDRKNMAQILRYIAGLIEAGHTSEGGIMAVMPTDTSVALSADFTISIVKPGALQ